MGSNYRSLQTQDAQIKLPSETFTASLLLAQLQKRSSIGNVVYYFEA